MPKVAKPYSEKSSYSSDGNLGFSNIKGFAPGYVPKQHELGTLQNYVKDDYGTDYGYSKGVAQSYKPQVEFDINRKIGNLGIPTRKLDFSNSFSGSSKLYGMHTIESRL